VEPIRCILPPDALNCFSPTLRVLRLDRCQILNLVAPPSFPHLEQLILYEVQISDDSLQSMISGSDVLESVSLYSMRFGRLCIRSPTLRSIGSHGFVTSEELVIEDAPCLERLLPLCPKDGHATIRVIHAPKLEILGFFCLKAYPHSSLIQRFFR
jgi:hypothetical protein